MLRDPAGLAYPFSPGMFKDYTTLVLFNSLVVEVVMSSMLDG